MIYDLIVIGGGACGLTCAVVAARRGKKVLVLEKEAKLGSKILVTGNGKCNLSATDVSPEKYNDPSFVAPVLSEDVLGFFKSIGVYTRTVDKRIYPYSESALTVVTRLRACLPPDCVREEKVTKIERDGVYKVNDHRAKNVLLCTGSAATKGEASYSLYAPFGHTIAPLRPSLVPLVTDVTFLKGLSGIRAKARVKLLSREIVVACEEGEILFRDNGISGIAAMCLSQTIARRPERTYQLSIDFIYDAKNDVSDYLPCGAEAFLHKAVAQAVERYAEKKKVSLMNALTDFRVEEVRCGDVTRAQVMCGGLRTKDFDSNLQSKLSPGLYAGGEVLDVDGECGGYNLHWAFACGLRIGKTVG